MISTPVEEPSTSRCCPFARTANYPINNESSSSRLCKHAFLCPPHGKIAACLTLGFALFYVWGTLWAITGRQALSGGNLFSLIVLLVSCSLAGKLVEMIKLPALLGMLIMGVCLRTIPVISVAKDIDQMWSSSIRNIALVVILTRAGLGLDPVALKKLSFAVVRLAFIPCLVETACCALTSHFLLGLPWTWGIMMGFVLAAVSPAVVVPSMLNLSERGYGIEKGIPTLVIAASSIDDVLAISGFGILLGIVFSEGNIAMTILKGPLEAIAGVAYGVILGACSWYIPAKDHENKTMYQFIFLFGGGLLVTFGSQRFDLAGAGALGCLTLAFVAAYGWRSQIAKGEVMSIVPIMSVLWLFFQPLLFGLIGAEIDIMNVDTNTIAMGVAVLCIGIFFRLIASYLAVLGTNLNLKERLFITIAWLPKATVQAAIGSVALDTARNKGLSPEIQEYGLKVLTIAVLVILITAPIGAIGIALAGPRLLAKTAKSIHDIDVPAVNNPREEGSEISPLRKHDSLEETMHHSQV